MPANTTARDANDGQAAARDAATPAASRDPAEAAATRGDPPGRAAVRRALEEALAARKRRAVDLERLDARIANGRLAAIVAAVAGSLVGLGSATWLLLLPVVTLVFVALVLWHGRVIGARRAADHAARYQMRQIDLASDRSRAEGSTGAEFARPGHGYASDLDVLGEHSLFKLLSAARTQPGEATTARWLLGHATRAEILERQAAVGELAERPDLREDLWVAGSDEEAGTHDPSPIARWAARERVLTSPTAWKVGAIVMSVVTTLALGLRISGQPGGSLLLAPVVLVHVALLAAIRGRVRTAVEGLEEVAPALKAYTALLERLEAEEGFSSARLASLVAALKADDGPASVEIGRLRRLAELNQNRLNPIVALFIGPLTFWELHCALSLERWRERTGERVAAWFQAVGEIEALAGFAALAAARPEYTMPEVVDGPPRFVAEGLGHPLIAVSDLRTNDLHLDPERSLLIVSGSNMSGKSTLLRAAGSAAVMALAGAPVCAARLTVTPLELLTSIRIADSLEDGSSHFHQEVLRLKQALDIARAGRPLFYLLDEILHGTNSRERTLGARALVLELVTRPAIGLVTTHDLAVTKLVDEIGERAANVHFTDRVEAGRMAFDYQMKPGVVQTTNALRLMRAVGIDLDFED